MNNMKVLQPLGVVLDSIPTTDDEWSKIPEIISKYGQGVLIVENLDVTGVELESILHKFGTVLGHSLLKYDRWPGQSPNVTNCEHLALLGNYKARKVNDIVSEAKIGDSIAEYKPATLELSEWHTDGSFLSIPKSYIALYAPKSINNALPPVGGETRFCSTKVMKGSELHTKYQHYKSVHSWKAFMKFLESRDPKRPKVTDEQCEAKPDQLWPLLRSQKRYICGECNSGEYLYINPKNTSTIYDENGNSIENPSEFVRDLCQQLLDTNGIYWHLWKPGQLVLWDNHVVLHAATPFDNIKYERLLYRSEFGPYYIPCTPKTISYGYLESEIPPNKVVATNKIPNGSIVVVDTVSGNNIRPPATTTNDDDERRRFTNIPSELYIIQDTVTDRLGPHILTGPIEITNAEPGDMLQIDIINIRLRSDWAYTLHKPSGGTEFRHTKLLPTVGSQGVAITEWGSIVDCDPFFGVIGVAPPPGTGRRVSSIPPSSIYGGNLDLKKLTAGSTLYLPVHHVGAMVYIGDGHARQGDGECCGTALETSLTGTFRFTVHKQQKSGTDSPTTTTTTSTTIPRNLPLKGVRAETSTELISIGVNENESIDTAVTDCVQNMIDWIQEIEESNGGSGISRIDAECLCSIAGDVAVTQFVNGTTRGAHMTLPKKYLPSWASTSWSLPSTSVPPLTSSSPSPSSPP